MTDSIYIISEDVKKELPKGNKGTVLLFPQTELPPYFPIHKQRHLSKIGVLNAFAAMDRTTTFVRLALRHAH